MNTEKIDFVEAKKRLDDYYNVRRGHIDNIKREEQASKALIKLISEMAIAENAINAIYGF